MSWNDNGKNGSRDPWGNRNDAPDIDAAITELTNKDFVSELTSSKITSLSIFLIACNHADSDEEQSRAISMVLLIILEPSSLATDKISSSSELTITLSISFEFFAASIDKAIKGFFEINARFYS